MTITISRAALAAFCLALPTYAGAQGAPPAPPPLADYFVPATGAPKAPDADGFLQRWLSVAAALLSPGGALLLVARPDNLPAIVEAGAGRYGDIRIRPVHPAASRRASSRSSSTDMWRP